MLAIIESCPRENVGHLKTQIHFRYYTKGQNPDPGPIQYWPPMTKGVFAPQCVRALNTSAIGIQKSRKENVSL